MSTSLFYNDMSNIPENYLVYINGEKNLENFKLKLQN